MVSHKGWCLFITHQIKGVNGIVANFAGGTNLFKPKADQKKKNENQR